MWEQFHRRQLHSSIPTGQRRGRNLRFGYFVKPQLIKKLGNGILSHSGYGNSVSISDTHVAVGAKGVGVVYVYDASDGTEIGNQLYQTGVGQFGHAVATSDGILVVGAPSRTTKVRSTSTPDRTTPRRSSSSRRIPRSITWSSATPSPTRPASSSSARASWATKRSVRPSCIAFERSKSDPRTHSADAVNKRPAARSRVRRLVLTGAKGVAGGPGP